MGEYESSSLLSPQDREILGQIAPQCVWESLLVLYRVNTLNLPHDAFFSVSTEIRKVFRITPHYPFQSEVWQRLFEKKIYRPLRRLQRSFRQSQKPEIPQKSGQRETHAFRIAAYLALAFIPTAALAGLWKTSLHESQQFFQTLLSSSDCEKVQLSQKLTVFSKTLTVPVLWALIFARLHSPPKEPFQQDDSAAGEILETLRRAAPLPPSVRVAAGALALVTSSSDADFWKEMAQQTALTHRAREFVRFFTTVTNR